MRRNQCTASAVASQAIRLGSGATKISQNESGHTKFEVHSRLRSCLSDCLRALALTFACTFPLSALATVQAPSEPIAAAADWVWAVPGQTKLRILALDFKRQQVVANVGNGRILVLNSGDLIPGLSIRFSAVSGSTAIFQPSAGPGSDAIERIAITLDRSGGQLTSTVRLSAPPQPVVGGWLLSPR